MKKTIVSLALMLSALHGAFAQSFNVQNGYTATKLFDTLETGPNFTISGLGVDTAGNIYYLQSGSFDGTPDTRLFERAATNFATPIQLYAYGTNVFGSFVKVQGSTVYFGETHGPFDNPLGTISAITLGGTAATIASVSGNYDLAFSGANAFLSAYNNGSSNVVSKLDVANGQLTPVLDTGGDFSGPIAFNAAGDLLYGVTAFAPGSVPHGVYEFSKAALDLALASGTAMALSNGTRILNNAGNQYFGYQNEQALFIADSSGPTGIVTRLNLSTSAQTAVGTAGSNQFLSAMDIGNSGLYVAVTSDFINGPSAVYRVTAVPEPSVWALLALSVAGASIFAMRKK